MSLSETSLEDCRQFWSNRYGRDLTVEDAREIMETLYEFVQILMDWKQQEHEEAKEAHAKSDMKAQGDTCQVGSDL